MAELTDPRSYVADMMEANETMASAIAMIDRMRVALDELREHSEATMSVLTEVLIATDAEIEALRAENEELRGGLRAAIGGYTWPAELLAKTTEAK